MEKEKMIIDACSNILIGIAESSEVSNDNIGVRIDLAKQKGKLILSVFDKATFVKRITIKELAKASGVGVMSGMISMSVRNIVQSIFNYALQQYELTTTKDIFILLHLKSLKSTVQLNTAIALYIEKELKETRFLGEILSEAHNS